MLEHSRWVSSKQESLSVSWWLPKSFSFLADFSSVVFIWMNFLDLIHTKTYIEEASDTSNFAFIKAELKSTIYHMGV